jgi:Flp pilus assembly protein TadG
MVEFAIILPLLLLLVFGIIEFSLLLYDKAVITNASREAARTSILYYDESLGSKPDPKAVAVKYAQDHLINFPKKQLADGDVTVTSDYQNNQWVHEVTVTYSYNFLVLPKFVTSIAGNIDLTAATIMRDEFQPPPPP